MIEIFLGFIQGITEFLPISSSGHLVLFSEIFKTENFDTYEIAFLHLGTLLSIIFFYFKDLIAFLKDWKKFKKISTLLLIGISPAILFGLILPISDVIDDSNYILPITGAAYLFLAAALYYSEKIKLGQKSIFDITPKDSLLIGLAQAVALVPGISRSGITLLTALYLKINKADAIFFSLLLAIPTIFGAWLLTFIKNSEPFSSSLIVPVVVAFLSGLAAIKILINFTVNSKLRIFSYYCLFIGGLTLTYYLINF